MPRKITNLNNACTREAKRKRVERANQTAEEIAARNAAQRVRTSKNRIREFRELQASMGIKSVGPMTMNIDINNIKSAIRSKLAIGCEEEMFGPSIKINSDNALEVKKENIFQQTFSSNTQSEAFCDKYEEIRTNEAEVPLPNVKSEELLTEELIIKEEINEFTEIPADTTKRKIRADKHIKQKNRYYAIKCTICQKQIVYNCKTILYEHIRNHYINNVRNCTQCNIEFKCIKIFISHMVNIHHQLRFNKFPCKECKKNFSTKTLYNIHMRKNHLKKLKPKTRKRKSKRRKITSKSKTAIKQNTAKCEEALFLENITCETLKNSLLNHVNSEQLKTEELNIKDKIQENTQTSDYAERNTHSNEEINRSFDKCSNNEERTETSISDGHIEEEEHNSTLSNEEFEDIDPRDCKKCKKLYDNHMRRHHPETLKSKTAKKQNVKESALCHVCGERFSNLSRLYSHIRRVHLKLRPYICELCDKGFGSSTTLLKHRKGVHLKLRPYICKICQKGYSSPYALRVHRRHHTDEKPFKCNVCNNTFKHKNSLMAHQESKHYIIESKNCPCPVCGKMFQSKRALTTHIRIH